MSDKAARAFAEKVASIGKGEPMEGEAGDRRFEAFGRAWRVRVRVQDAIAPAAPVNGSPDLAPAIYGLSISVALLDDAGAVARDEAGGFVVFPSHALTLQGEAFVRVDFAAEAEILGVVADEIASANAQLEGRMQLPGALAAWRGK